MIFDFILLIISIEAATELIFHAAPLQRPRLYLIAALPRLAIPPYGHLLDCPYCVSVWVSVFFTGIYFSVPAFFVTPILFFLSCHRLANFLHLIFRWAYNHNLDLLLRRGD